ncbi:MAG: hypothetical protein JO336_11285 [Acidobacteriia bacterium]|nr:hypothetical protein [Terriglobia bacterium]
MQTTASAQSDPFLGTWNLNVTKSEFAEGPAATSETRVIEPWETDGIKYTSTMVLADGTRATLSFSAHYDGKDYKTTGSPNFDTISLKRVDANTLEFTVKKDGNVVGTGKNAVSNDGKTTTRTATATNAEGQKIASTAVFDKQ